MATTYKQKQSLDKYVDAIYELLHDQLLALRTTQSRQIKKSRPIFARMLGQLLFDAPKLHTGLVSIELVQQKLLDFSTRPVIEHHHGRQNGGEALLSLVDSALSMDRELEIEDVSRVVHQYCEVHYTTASENIALRKQQQLCSSAAAYRRTNIPLIEARDLFTKAGKHTESWKQQMRTKYHPIIDQYFNPVDRSVLPPVMPLVIN